MPVSRSQSRTGKVGHGTDDRTFTYTTGGLIDTIENPAGTVDIDYDEFNRVERVDGILTRSADTLLWTWNAGYSQLDQIDGPNGNASRCLAVSALC